MKRLELFSIFLTVLLIGCFVLLIGVFSFFNNLLNYSGVCNGRVPGKEWYTGETVTYQWIPDGTAIVIMNKMGTAQLGTRFDLVQVDEGKVERLISYPAGALIDNFTVSPSGQYMAISETDVQFFEVSEEQFQAESYHDLAIFEVDYQVQTPELRLLMTIPETYAGLWSHDEKYIALAAVPDPALPKQSIHVAQFAPTIAQVITLTESENTSWSPLVGWSANSLRLVADMNVPNGLRLIDIGSGTVDVLNESKTCFSDMTLSPTEDKMALSSHEHSAHDAGERGWDIIIKNIPAGTNEIVTDFIDEDEIQPTWSPDGTRLAFVRAFTDELGQAQQEIMIVDLASNSMTNLTWAGDLMPFFPKWSPRGDKIAFLTDDGREYHLHVIDVEGGKPVDLYSTGDY